MKHVRKKASNGHLKGKKCPPSSWQVSDTSWLCCYQSQRFEEGMKSSVFQRFNTATRGRPGRRRSPPQPPPPAKENIWDSAERLQFFRNSLLQSKLLKEVGMRGESLDRAGTLTPFTPGVVLRCVCFQKCAQTFVIITCHLHPELLERGFRRRNSLFSF